MSQNEENEQLKQENEQLKQENEQKEEDIILSIITNLIKSLTTHTNNNIKVIISVSCERLRDQLGTNYISKIFDIEDSIQDFTIRSWYQYIIAYYFDSKNDIDEYAKKAFFWYEQAMENGNTYAMIECGQHYISGSGIKTNVDKGIECFEKAAEYGNIWAIEPLAETYLYIKKNYIKAFEYHIKYCKLTNKDDCLYQYKDVYIITEMYNEYSCVKQENEKLKQELDTFKYKNEC